MYRISRQRNSRVDRQQVRRQQRVPIEGVGPETGGEEVPGTLQGERNHSASDLDGQLVAGVQGDRTLDLDQGAEFTVVVF